MGNRKRKNRSGFYMVVLTMFLVSVSLFVYAENELDHVGETQESDLSGFVAIEMHVQHGAQSLMRTFLPSTGRAYAEQPESVPDTVGAVVLSTADDGKNLTADEDDSDLPDEILLAERAISWQEYIVKNGETLSEIVGKFSGISLNDVVRANELGSAHKLVGKQILLVPLGEEFVEDTLEEVRTRKARVVASREGNIPVEVKSYVVKDGETLWSIAGAEDVEVDTLIGSNTLGAVLRVGETLRVPNQDGIFWTLKAGETVRSISAKFKVPLNIVQQVNRGVNIEMLAVGAEFFLPGARPEAAESSKVQPKGSKTKDSGASVSGPFRWPVAGKISSGFGWRKHPITKRADFHSALDIRAPRGTSIRASRGGTVVFSGWQGAYGKVLVIDHGGGLSTLYSHCSSLLANKGEKVSAGQVVARVGSTGRATGPHVHFELRVNNKAVNPLRYLK